MNLTDFSAPTTQSSTPAAAGGNGNGFLGGMDISTISALVVLASAFMRR